MRHILLVLLLSFPAMAADVAVVKSKKVLRAVRTAERVVTYQSDHSITIGEDGLPAVCSEAFRGAVDVFAQVTDLGSDPAGAAKVACINDLMGSVTKACLWADSTLETACNSLNVCTNKGNQLCGVVSENLTGATVKAGERCVVVCENVGATINCSP